MTGKEKMDIAKRLREDRRVLAGIMNEKTVCSPGTKRRLGKEKIETTDLSQRKKMRQCQERPKLSKLYGRDKERGPWKGGTEFRVSKREKEKVEGWAGRSSVQWPAVDFPDPAEAETLWH